MISMMKASQWTISLKLLDDGLPTFQGERQLVVDVWGVISSCVRCRSRPNSRLTVLRCKVRSWWCKKTGRMIAICVQWSSLDNWWLDKCDLLLESGNIHGTKCPVRLMPKNRCRRSGLNNFAHSVSLPKPPHKIGGKSRQSVLKWRPTEEKQRHCLLQKPQLLAVACRFPGQVTFSPYWKFRLHEVKTPLDSSPEGAYRDLHCGMWKHDETLQC